MEKLPLWDVTTHWFIPPRDYTMSVTAIMYRSWKDFTDCRPYHLWKPYTLTSWAWKNDKLQLVFMTPYTKGSITSYVEIPVVKDNEPAIREWILRHMPQFWKI